MIFVPPLHPLKSFIIMHFACTFLCIFVRHDMIDNLRHNPEMTEIMVSDNRFLHVHTIHVHIDESTTHS